MNGFYPLRIMIPIGKPNGGTFADLWQQIEDGKQAKLVTLEGVEVTLPDVYEAIPLGNQIHFAPGVVNDPSATTYTPPTLDEFKTALIASAQAVAKGDPETYSAWVKAEHDKAKGKG